VTLASPSCVASIRTEDIIDPMNCDICGHPIAPHAHYVVRIDVFADPTVPQMSFEELEAESAGGKMHELLEHLKSMSTEELQDQVHRRFEHTICRPCQNEFLKNPLGKPRGRLAGEN